MGAERVARVTYRHEAADGETYVLVSDVVELPATCRATIPDEVAPWADRTRDTPAFRGAVRLTRPGGSFAVTAATRGVVDAFVRATLVAMLACEVTVERLLVFDVAIRARGAPGVDAWGRVLDRATYRRGEVSRVTWSEPAPGEDPEVDALNAMTRGPPGRGRQARAALRGGRRACLPPGA